MLDDGDTMLRVMLFSSFLEKNEELRKFFYYHHNMTSLRIIEGIQISVLLLLLGTVLTGLFLKLLDVVMAISLVIMTFCGVIFLPQVIYVVKYKKVALFIKQVGLIVLYEFTIVLETTGSIYDAVKMVIQGNYPYYSSSFRNALLQASFGYDLVELLKIELKKLPFQEITLYFIQLFETWSSSKSLITQFKHDIKNNLQIELSEKNRYVSIYSAFYMAMASIMPPIVSILLILNDLFFPIIWVIFGFNILLLIFGSPFKMIYVLADNWGLNPEKNNHAAKISEILSNLKDSMNTRISFEFALINVMKKVEDKNQSIVQLKEDITTGLSFSHQKIKKELQEFFTSKTVHFLRMYYRFVTYDEKKAVHVVNGVISGARDIESGISEVIKSIKAERMRFILTIVISLFVMGILTNLVDIFKLITFLSKEEGFTAIRSIATNHHRNYSEILKSQHVLGEQVVMGVYALISSLFVSFFQPSVENEEIMRFDEEKNIKMFDFFKNSLLRICLAMKNSFPLYAFYCIGYLLSVFFLLN